MVHQHEVVFLIKNIILKIKCRIINFILYNLIQNMSGYVYAFYQNAKVSLIKVEIWEAPIQKIQEKIFAT